MWRNGTKKRIALWKCAPCGHSYNNDYRNASSHRTVKRTRKIKDLNSMCIPTKLPVRDYYGYHSWVVETRDAVGNRCDTCFYKWIKTRVVRRRSVLKFFYSFSPVKDDGATRTFGRVRSVHGFIYGLVYLPGSSLNPSGRRAKRIHCLLVRRVVRVTIRARRVRGGVSFVTRNKYFFGRHRRRSTAETDTGFVWCHTRTRICESVL